MAKINPSWQCHNSISTLLLMLSVEITICTLSQSFRQVLSMTSDSTVDCESWEQVEVLEHNKQVPEGARLSEKVETNLEAESSDHRKESFAKVYDNDEWGKERKSGPGSLLENSWTVIKVLDILVEKIKKDLGKKKIRCYVDSDDFSI